MSRYYEDINQDLQNKILESAPYDMLEVPYIEAIDGAAALDPESMITGYTTSDPLLLLAELMENNTQQLSNQMPHIISAAQQIENYEYMKKIEAIEDEYMKKRE